MLEQHSKNMAERIISMAKSIIDMEESIIGILKVLLKYPKFYEYKRMFL